ncbi:MAG: hypothetical protein E4H20_03200 [Spirochaetales bacterium]|nr:MAG: hypothetical protein E4H20_03200 [Spirochaetales bacterium]
MSINEISKSLKENLMSLLSNKPMWVFWIAYSVLSGIFFGIFYAATYFLALQWWVATLVIIAIGVIWGTAVYTKSKQKEEEKKEV